MKTQNKISAVLESTKQLTQIRNFTRKQKFINDNKKRIKIKKAVSCFGVKKKYLKMKPAKVLKQTSEKHYRLPRVLFKSSRVFKADLRSFLKK